MRQRRIESDAEPLCCYARCRRAIPHCSSDDAASIPKSGPEIKNRCTKDGVNRQNPASIPKSEPEIKNQCTQLVIFSTRLQEESRRRYFAWTRVRQWRRKRVQMRPEAAFPYVFAAEGAQHPPKAATLYDPAASSATLTGPRRIIPTLTDAHQPSLHHPHAQRRSTTLRSH